MSLRSLNEECRNIGVPLQTTNYQNYLRDESKFNGSAIGVLKPKDESQVRDLIQIANKYLIPLTISAGRSSLTGSSVPQDGLILDITGLNSVDPRNIASVGPGMITAQYKEIVSNYGAFFPPDPTSADSSTLGGNIACNASGALSYLYGPTRDYIEQLNVTLGSGHSIVIPRNKYTAENLIIQVHKADFSPPLPYDLEIDVKDFSIQSWRDCKNSTGIQFSNPPDFIDLFIGTEGIFGAITAINCKLLSKRKAYFALMIYLPTIEKSCDFIFCLDLLRQYFHLGVLQSKIFLEDLLIKYGASEPRISDFHLIYCSCMEWFGNSVSRLLEANWSSQLSEVYGSLYIKQEYDFDEHAVMEQWFKLIEIFDQSQTPITASAATDVNHIRKWKSDRQTIPEKLNELIKPGFTKLATDFAVPFQNLFEFLELHDQLPVDKTFVFGHIGNAHLHANLLPTSEAELKEFQILIRNMAGTVYKMGGTISGEHGVGKLKSYLYKQLIGEEAIDKIRKIKTLMDPNAILNRGNIFY